MTEIATVPLLRCIGQMVEDGDEDIARERYGDVACDAYFRLVEGLDVHDGRCACGNGQSCMLRDASLPYTYSVLVHVRAAGFPKCTPGIVDAVLEGSVSADGFAITPTLRDEVLMQAIQRGTPVRAGVVEGIVTAINGRRYTLDVPGDPRPIDERPTFDVAELLPLVSVDR